MRVPPSSSRQYNISLLKTVTQTRDLNLGKAIHAQMIKSYDPDPDPVQSNHLVILYAKCGHLLLARRLFDEMPEKNVVSHSAMMAGYSHNGFPSEALTVLKSMNNVCPNEYIFTTALAACSNTRSLDEGKQCHAFVVKSGFSLYSHIRNALLHMYTRCSGMEDALGVFKTIHEFDAFSFNSMINGFRDHGRLEEAVDVLRTMAKEVASWDHVTYVALLGLCADCKDSESGRQIHNQILKRGVEEVFVGSAIVDFYGKTGDIPSARCAFDGLSCRNVVSWTSLIAVCTKNGFFEESLNLFLRMEDNGVRTNELSYVVALNSCAGLSALRNGDAINARAEKSGYKAHLVVGNALINAYSKSGSIEDAQKVFMEMHCWDIVSWNSIITGYSHHGLGREAMQAFHSMLIEEEVPTYVTFIGVLSACAHLRLVDEGFYHLNHSMRNFGIEPGVEHFTCMVGLLCRSGLLDKAEIFMRDTCTEWDVVAWRTLLIACQVHRNFRLGKRVAEHILMLDPRDIGTYILLSNMYAKANRWDGVAKIRKLMRGRDIKKEPGVSWIQVRNETHVFACEDKKHPWMIQIREKLADLIARIKLAGYVPNIASVLHDVGDEQKEEYLSYHSEKMAVAFGMIRLPKGAPIHVIKNLRMCDDCHIAMKLISKVTSRKIIIRDVNHFHRFSDGICSCDDYW